MAATVVAMDEVDPESLMNIDRALIICSTYGEGDMPDNAQQLWDHVTARRAGFIAAELLRFGLGRPRL